VDPCTGERIGGGTTSVSANFTVVNVQIAEAWKAVRVNGTTSFTLTNTCGAVTWSVSPQQTGGPYANGSTIVAGTNCGSWTVTATSTVNTNCTASATLYVVNLTGITDAAGNPISSAYSNNVVIVGQAINLTAQTCGGTFSNFLWNVDGSTFSYYIANDSIGVVETDFTLTNSTVDFYWKDGGPKQVSVSAVCSNINFSTSVTLTVLRPTAPITTKTGTVGLDGGALHFGFNTLISLVGISFTNTVTMPTGYYNSGDTNFSIRWTQKIGSTVRRLQTNDASGAWYSRRATDVLDTHYDYGFDDYPETSDSPFQGLGGTAYKSASVSDSFTMFLLFRPAGGEWVPLRQVDWSWGAAANLVGATWVLTSTNNAVNPADSDSTAHPEWTDNWVNSRFQRE
jgi:hypothetical protein